MVCKEKPKKYFHANSAGETTHYNLCNLTWWGIKMSLRKFMHPRNIYKKEPNFKQLAIQDSEFRKFITTDLAGKVRINFQNLESLRALAKTLLKHDFNLHVEIPVDKLVPAIPSRLNYVLWIEDLAKHAGYVDMSLISGIDIGTGAVCVYPLLFANMYRCKMIGTEIDSDSHESALLNIKRNNFENLIDVIRVQKGTVLRGVLPENNVCYTFMMCNPPFFGTEETMACKLKGTRLPPRNAPSGSKVELVVDGGETQFVSKMLEDSFELKDRIKIYTTMLGKKSSLIFLQNELKKLNVENSTWTEFCQGHTTRWGLAWTFLPNDQIDLTTAPVIRTSGARTQLKQKAKKAPSEIVFPAHSDITKAKELVAALKFWIQKLKIRVDELPINEQKSNCWGCQLMADEDTWSHERRKRRMMANQNSPSKRPRLNVSVEESCEKESESSVSTNGGNVRPITGSFLLCNLVAGEVKTDDKERRLKISMEFESGSGGKNALETLRQYFINKLNLREFMKGKSSDKKHQKRQRVRKKRKHT